MGFYIVKTFVKDFSIETRWMIIYYCENRNFLPIFGVLNTDFFQVRAKTARDLRMD